MSNWLRHPSPSVCVAIPTIEARGDRWREAAAAFQAHTCQPVTVIPSYAPGGWAAGLNEVWRQVRIRQPDVFVCGSDDMLPEDDNWLPPLLAALARGVYPAPCVIDPRWTNYGGHRRPVPDGTPSQMASFPVLHGGWCDAVFPLPPDLSYYCMPEDHRILTQRGYKRHDETIIGEPVLVRDPETRELRWEPLQAVTVLPYDGDLITINRKGESFEFTPEHRWLVRNSNQRDHHFRQGRDLTTNLVIEVYGDYRETETCLSPRYAAMLGWVVGDGTYYKGKYNRMCVYQMPTEKLEEIEQLLGMKRMKAMPNGVHAVSVQADDRRELEKVYSGKDDLPRVVCNLSRESAEAMIDALIKAEGNRTAYGGTCISQDHKAVAVREAIQILTLLTGHTAGLGQKGHSIFVRTAKALSLNGPNTFGWKHHKGYVWCPTTPTGTWIVEHEGAIIPTGNCDNLIAVKLRMAGIECVAVPSSRIRHLWLPEGRGFGLGSEQQAMRVHSQRYAAALTELGVDRGRLPAQLRGPKMAA